MNEKQLYRRFKRLISKIKEKQLFRRFKRLISKIKEKQLYRRFKRLISKISCKKTWTELRNEKLQRETESLLIATQDNSIKTQNIKARIDKTQQNSKCRLCRDREETINHIISKSAQKEYKTRHDWVGKVIPREFCKKLKFEHQNKWHMHNPETVLENETYKLQWDLTDKQTS